MFGIVTGLIPGVHVNLIAILLLSFVPYLSTYFTKIDLGVFLISMVIVHSFLDFIPSIFLGAPEGETALSVLPGHDFLLNGRGYDALKFTISGGIGASILSILFIPLLFVFLESAYNSLSHFIIPLLVIFSILFILQERRRLWALILFLLSGTLGVIVLNGINIKQPLFPLLSGLFGIPVLVISLFNQDKIIIQRVSNNIKLLRKNRITSYLKASLSSILVSIMPGVGSAQAAIIASGFSKHKKDEDFLVTLGGINTSGAIFTLTVFYILGKARTGVISSLQQLLSLNLQHYMILVVAALTSVGFGIMFGLKIGKIFANRISKINYRKVSKFIIVLIILLVVILTGLVGFVVLSVASAVGLLAPCLKVKRIHLMGCLIMPVIFYSIL
ncbi:MAG: tripartite tricarboxylate transporter permease [Candidatus Woesearchaeota archaeon]|nr:MAG: tripartite tricarboxylate transporter permease [Candidatus Woesearchaeota archaeon]